MDTTLDRPLDRERAAPPPRAQLRLVFPSALATTIELGPDEVVLGRKADRGVFVLDDPTVSRRHFGIRWNAGARQHEGIEHGSRNGSRVDGKTLRKETPPVALQDGSVIRAGDVIGIYERGEAVCATDRPEVSRDAVPGDAAATVQLREQIAMAAADMAPLLLVGETGTGKELIAREAHRLSGRKGPFLAINCAALSPQLIESQLFGHVKGAFTGATESQNGLFRAASGGTLLLDEIGELPIDLQPKLLRVLQEREVLPVGATRAHAVDVRVVAATLRDVGKLARESDGAFRLDLYARLSAWEIRVPALRERRADILGWLARFHHAWLSERDRDPSPPTIDAVGAEGIVLDAWPENLRGLERLVHRVCSRGASTPYALPNPVATNTEPAAPARRKRRARPSKEELAGVLAENGGSVRATAKHYDRERRQIYRWLEHYGLKAED